MSAESTEQLAHHFDTEEAICARLAERRDNARTFIGRAILSYRLESHRQRLSQITDEFDIIILHGNSSATEHMR
jgi:hypothetical protein